MSATEIVKAAVSPIEKLINAVSGAIGKAYEPRHIRKMADAKAYEINKISEELRNNSDLPIQYIGGETSIDLSDFQSLVERTGFRLAYKEIKKQENIEAIVDKASLELDGEVLKSNEPISKDWMNRFIAHAGEISDEDMQNIWAKILAGEVLSPKSFSLRTLEVLTNMTSHEAKIFEKVSELVTQSSALLNYEDFYKKHGVIYSDILLLSEIGLISSNGMIVREIPMGKEETLIIDFGDYLLLGCCPDKTNQTLSIREFPLTTIGREIYSILDHKSLSEDIVKNAVKTLKNNSGYCRLSVHKVFSRSSEKISYDFKELGW